MKNVRNSTGTETRENATWNTGIVLLVVIVMVAMLGPGLVFSMLQAADIMSVQLSRIMYPAKCTVMIVMFVAVFIVAIVGGTSITPSPKNR